MYVIYGSTRASPGAAGTLTPLPAPLTSPHVPGARDGRHQLLMRTLLAAVVLGIFGADAGRGFVPPRRVVEEVVEHCVSSRWGFTCLTPRNAPPKILDVLVAKAKADASMMARFAGRSMIGVTAGWLSYETYVSLRDMRNYPSSAFDATLPQARRTRIATAPPRQRRGGGSSGGSGGGRPPWAPGGLWGLLGPRVLGDPA